MCKSDKLGLNIIDITSKTERYENSQFLLKENPLYKPEILAIKLEDVIFDVNYSYLESIKQSYYYFTGKQISLAQINEAKALGGYCDNCALIKYLVEQYGFNFAYEDIVSKFKEIYWNDGQGHINQEQLLVEKSLLNKLSTDYRLVALTQDTLQEATFKLCLHSVEHYFTKIIASDSVSTGNIIKKTKIEMNSEKILLIGSSIDDMKLAVSENVPAIAICDSKELQLIEILNNNGAHDVLPNLDRLPDILSVL